MADLAVIALLALVTYGCRVGGWLVLRRVRPGPRLTAWLGHVPGATFAALVAPMAADAGPPGWAAAGVGFAVGRISGAFMLAMLAGLATYIALDRILP